VTLFVVVQRRVGTTQEYIADETSLEGYAEYSAAQTDATAVQEDLGSGWVVYVARAVEVIDE
jgi:hypothetical protein